MKNVGNLLFKLIESHTFSSGNSITQAHSTTSTPTRSEMKRQTFDDDENNIFGEEGGFSTKYYRVN